VRAGQCVIVGKNVVRWLLWLVRSFHTCVRVCTTVRVCHARVKWSKSMQEMNGKAEELGVREWRSCSS
jgi:hypothetical protein